MRRGLKILLISAASVVVVAALTAAIVWGAFIRVDGPSASLAAANRPCERDYVQPITQPVGTTLPLLRVDTVADIEQPTTVALWPGDHDTGVVGDRLGKIFAIRDGKVDEGQPLIDVSKETEQEGDGGLLTAVYDPDGEWLYVWRATPKFDDLLEAYPSPDGVPTLAGRKLILFVDHPPIDQHHGGGLAFGPDGHLYIGTGDGGGLGDPDGNAQKLSTLLGKVLRIDPTPAGPKPYTIPANNPFVHRAGARPEIFAYGLRNPFRLSFSGKNLWLPDVGHSCWEEINFEPNAAGGSGGWNFGWDFREGTHPFQGQGHGSYTDPITDYSHLSGYCVVIGGYEYHGTAIPGMQGAFMYDDFCAGDFRVLRYRAGQPVQIEDTSIRVPHPVAVDPGPDGAPWILSLDGTIDEVRLAGSGTP